MAAPYSLDLRKRVVAKYKEGGISQSGLAKLFKVGISTVKRYIKLDKVKGDLLPIITGKGRPARIDNAGYETIKKLLTEEPCLTLGDLSKNYFEIHQEQVGLAILSRAYAKLKLSRKKLSIYASERESDAVKKKRRLSKSNIKYSSE